MASISFACTDEEKELIKKIAGESAYNGMSGYCRYIVVSATKAIDNARHGTEYPELVRTEIDGKEGILIAEEHPKL